MSSTILDREEDRVVGTVQAVSSNAIVVKLHSHAPDYVALQDSEVIPFPRIYRFLSIPLDDRFLLGRVISMEQQESPLPSNSRREEHTADMVTLPHANYVLTLMPWGTVGRGKVDSAEYERGMGMLPSVGAPALLPTAAEIRAMEGPEEERRVLLGHNPFAANAPVYINPDKVFPRHLAVLGNTGSGKSCSIAGLIHSCITSSNPAAEQGKHHHFRLILLDPNGEYSAAFSASKELRNIGVKVLRLGGDSGKRSDGNVSECDNDERVESLQVPFWFWNAAEWIAFAKAAPQTQEPALRDALRFVKGGSVEPEDSIGKRDIHEDAPISFTEQQLIDKIKETKAQQKETLIARIRNLLNNVQIRSIVKQRTENRQSLEEWIQKLLGGQDIVIVDMSLVPYSIIHTVVSVMSRMIHDALQRYYFFKGKVLPTVLVLDEAHIFVPRKSEGGEWKPPDRVCCESFERIAREGRKFGLGLVISSQRPSGISPTVLSQCNTFLLHRLTNDADQDLMRRLLPDSIGGLLDELPLLPPRHAILLGWASETPMVVRVRDLPDHQRPRSADPSYWRAWRYGTSADGTKLEENVSWKEVVKVWQAGDG